MKISEFWCQSEDTAKNSELDESNGDQRDKKRTLKFVAEIQVFIDNNLSKLLRFIAKVMGMYEFLIRQLVHEDIWYFSYKMRNGQFLT